MLTPLGKLSNGSPGGAKMTNQSAAGKPSTPLGKRSNNSPAANKMNIKATAVEKIVIKTEKTPERAVAEKTPKKAAQKTPKKEVQKTPKKEVEEITFKKEVEETTSKKEAQKTPKKEAQKTPKKEVEEITFKKEVEEKTSKKAVEKNPKKAVENAQKKVEKPAKKSPSVEKPAVNKAQAKKKEAASAVKTKKVKGGKVAAGADSSSLTFPSLEEDKTLAELSETTRKMEQEAEKAAKKTAGKASETDENTVPAEKIKVKRKGAAPSKPAAEENSSYLSISDPKEDNKEIAVPKYRKTKMRGVVYIGHIPHGFYEKQMREFFSQFGTITNLKLGRSKNTGASRGFAFIEFRYKEVAKIVAETMNNYLMFEKLLKVELLSEAKSNVHLFRGKVKEHKPPKVAARRKAKRFLNAEKEPEAEKKRKDRTMKRLKELKKKLAEAGIDYSPAVVQ